MYRPPGVDIGNLVLRHFRCPLTAESSRHCMLSGGAQIKIIIIHSHGENRTHDHVYRDKSCLQSHFKRPVQTGMQKITDHIRVGLAYWGLRINFRILNFKGKFIKVCIPFCIKWTIFISLQYYFYEISIKFHFLDLFLICIAIFQFLLNFIIVLFYGMSYTKGRSLLKQ